MGTQHAKPASARWQASIHKSKDCMGILSSHDIAQRRMYDCEWNVKAEASDSAQQIVCCKSIVCCAQAASDCLGTMVLPRLHHQKAN